MARLAQIVPLSQSCLAEVLEDGDFAIDLTAGNGHDTLFLCRCVGSSGSVLAFDIQQQALDNTAERLQAAGCQCDRAESPPNDDWTGALLVNASHDRVGQFVSNKPKAVMANLGYLPGGDKTIITKPETTRTALRQAADLLAVGGRISVVVYTGHPGGRAESDQIDAWFGALAADRWDVLRTQILNRPESPYLLVAEKKR